ncbi:hypothetical protein BC828DRAFT_404745 [Blastocladiella britannica]|nr:hypothetical protein BC828DRAFT_404745 [Blastocladiella britannica]
MFTTNAAVALGPIRLPAFAGGAGISVAITATTTAEADGSGGKVTPENAREAVQLLDNAISDFVDPRYTLEYHHVLFGARPACFPARDDQAKVRAAVAAALAAMGSLAPRKRRYQHDVMFLLPADQMTALPDWTWTLGHLDYAPGGEYLGSLSIAKAMKNAGAASWFLNRRSDKTMTLTVIGKDRHVQLPAAANLVGLMQPPGASGWTHHGTAARQRTTTGKTNNAMQPVPFPRLVLPTTPTDLEWRSLVHDPWQRLVGCSGECQGTCSLTDSYAVASVT